MEKKSFKKLFLRSFFLITLQILGSTAFSTDFNSEEEYENIKILMSGSGGLQFYKEDSPAGRKLIYDCELGFKSSGSLNVFDAIHPPDMKSLIVKNCYDLSIYIDSCDYSKIQLQELKIRNVTSLKFNAGRNCWSSASLLHTDFEISISNVQFLQVDDFNYRVSDQSLSLKLQNVVMDTLKIPFGGSELRAVNLHLKNVKIKETKSRALYSQENPIILTIEDSHFENVHSNAFDFEGEVKVINSTFGFIDEGAFSINTTSPFIFSGNHVKRMQNPFRIVGYEVHIFNNTFDSITTPWLLKIITPRSISFGLLNITGNIINHWSQNLFYMDPLYFPDIIIFEGNYLNCSCKNAISVSYKIQNYITEVFLSKEHKNFCQNLGNCPLDKALGQGSGICSGTFRCPEDQNEDDESARVWGTHLKSILSVLKNIDNKLDQIVLKHNSPLVDKPN